MASVEFHLRAPAPCWARKLLCELSAVVWREDTAAFCELGLEVGVMEACEEVDTALVVGLAEEEDGFKVEVGWAEFVVADL